MDSGAREAALALGLRCDPGSTKSLNSVSRMDSGGGGEDEADEVEDMATGGVDNATLHADASERCTGKNDWEMARGKKRKGLFSQPLAQGKDEPVFKVVLRFKSPCTVNPIKASEEVKKLVGSVLAVIPLRDGNLMITCRNKDQQHGLLQCKTFLGNAIQPQEWEVRGKVLGVITGVSTDLSEDDIKMHVRGAKVIKVKRLPYTREGVKSASLSVMLSMDENELPSRVSIGYVSYVVRPYIPSPTRCYKCQRFGHIAAACRASLRCAKCGGEHEYGKCVDGAKIKCCNCGGEHSAAYKGCAAHKRAVQVQNVRVKERLTYADAIKKVDQSRPNLRQPPVSQPVSQPDAPFCSQTVTPPLRCDITEDTLIIEKKTFVAFMIYVINCTAQANTRTEKIDIIISAAEKFLGMEKRSLDSVDEVLSARTSGSQQSCGGGS